MKIKNKFQKVCSIILLSLSLAVYVPVVLPSPVYAQSDVEKSRCKKFLDGFTIGNKSKGTQVNIAGDKKVFCSASELILTAINYALIISGSVTVLFIIIGGFWYLTSAGNDEQAEKGKKTLVNAVIGLVVIILSFAIVRIISNTFTTASLN
jgi:cytochrome bd-type quinol oxidase subunit 2